MLKNKHWIVVVVALMIFGGSLGFMIWRGKNKHQIQQFDTGVRGANTEQLLTQTTDPNSIPLNQAGPQTKSSSGLSVAPNSAANNLGQITPNESSNNSSSASSSAAQMLDPATFSQYEKYKNDNNALFGEIQSGNGDELTAGKKAAVYYKGWLTSGQLFDMSRTDKDGQLQPFVFEMGANQVIPGWEQGLVGMKVGGTRLLIVPPSVGYGTAGQGPIPGNAVLIFQVQLLAIQ